MDNNIIDKVALIHISNKKILSTRSKSKDKLYFPGGKREHGENDLACLTREIHEELNVNIVENSVSFFGVFEAVADGREKDIVVQMSCYFAEFTGTLTACNEIEHFEWISFVDKDRTSAVDRLILQKLYDLKLID
ncbi:NUDIX hydrolase [Sphingobacterium detergens]|uniref:8-oxo-dGTP pyrophosphatase MutT (NUDIX family) n=1 Tax=Sphingobacterium detergens TaxID=1145106 RepID=A0A420AR19_SPHD1|nr:NUDIX domain-containing protein [Sphingobacterium detergens]RKE46896.1 8-oxo-dGTP pyrophosphatase MutT (NUDIX family) [Sphingobacterium detergens]